jgi:hypothetical protein
MHKDVVYQRIKLPTCHFLKKGRSAQEWIKLRRVKPEVRFSILALFSDQWYKNETRKFLYVLADKTFTTPRYQSCLDGRFDGVEERRCEGEKRITCRKASCGK